MAYTCLTCKSELVHGSYLLNLSVIYVMYIDVSCIILMKSSKTFHKNALLVVIKISGLIILEEVKKRKEFMCQ